MTTGGDQEPSLRPVTPLSILAYRLEELTARLVDVSDTDPGLLDELRSLCALASGLDPYIERCTTPASDALAHLAERTRSADWAARADGSGGPMLEAEMLSGHVEGRTLQFLVRLGRARRVLDIGMFTGYSALAMAEALPGDGEVVACELDPDVATFARECFDASPDGDKITIMVGPAIESLATLADSGSTFDLVFIDADKGGYAAYLDAVLERGLLGPDGLICVDNTLLQGQPYLPDVATENGDAIARFNQSVVDDPRLEQVLLPVRDGLTLIRRVD